MMKEYPMVVRILAVVGFFLVASNKRFASNTDATTGITFVPISFKAGT